MTSPSTQRPILVWIISGFFFLSAGYTLYAFISLISGATPLNAQQQLYVDSLTPINYMTSIGIAALNLSAAVMLFLLKKQAAPLFLAGFTLGILSGVYNIATTNWLETGAASVVGFFLSQLLVLAVVAYVFKLRKRGTLT